VTTCEPGASDVLTHGLTVSPRATAAFASRPAPSSTDGFDVFVQLVIAAITTAPWPSGNVPRSVVACFCTAMLPGAGAPPSLAHASTAAASQPALSPRMPPTALRHARRLDFNGTRSCGRAGPASDGSTVPRSSDTVSEKRSLR